MADYNQILLTYIARNNLAREAIDRKIDSSNFPQNSEQQRVWELIKSHYNKYQTTPTVDIIRSKFPSFTEQTGEYTFDFLCDELHNNKLDAEVLATMKTVADMYRRKVPAADKIEYLTNFIGKAGNSIRKSQDTSWVQTADDRRQEYERIELGGGATGIPCYHQRLSQITGGYATGDYWLVVARPNVGKCVKYDTPILNPETGVYDTIENVVKNKSDVFTTDGINTYRVTPSAWVNTGKKQCLKVTLNSGKEISGTPEHPLYTAEGWKRIDKLRIGDSIRTVSFTHDNGQCKPKKFNWEIVVYIEDDGIQQVYDLSIAETHNFIANDIVCHNTWYEIIQSWHTHNTGYRTMLFSKEMRAKPIMRRLDAMQAKVPYYKLRKGILSAYEKTQYFNSLEDLSVAKNDLVIISDDQGSGISGIDAKIHNYRPDIVFVDAVYLMKDDLGGKDQHVRLNNISQGLKELANKTGVPIVATAQLNRDADKQGSGSGTRAGLSNIFGSDGFGQAPDVVLALSSNEEMLRSSPQKLKVDMIKYREASGADCSYHQYINWDMDKMEFQELSEEENETFNPKVRPAMEEKEMF